MRDILSVGTSAGGARAKAVIAFNPVTQVVRSGQVDAGPGFEHWLLKFDGVRGNRDKELEDPRGYGVIEFAYANMARAAGIEISECRLLEENGRRHFMTRRFDRVGSGGKLHMQSLGALAHYDFNQPGAHSYEQALRVIRQLGLGIDAVEQQFRRMAFNVVARNQDDHVKNIAFLMDRNGRWSLSPAFDVTYAHQPGGRWTDRHQMSLNEKRDGFTIEDFRACARMAAIKRGRAEQIVDQVSQAVRRWPEFAAAAGVPDADARQIGRDHRLQMLSPVA
jgi:serine/threonine-protein kinase HipA